MHSKVGVGLKPAHYREALSPRVVRLRAGQSVEPPDFFEVHAENYMGDGGAPHAWLTAIREKFQLSLHGVCLSIGGADPLDKNHLKRLKALTDRYDPAFISEHLAWSAHGGMFFNDLIAPPFSTGSLARIASHVSEAQDALGRRILIENPSHYLSLRSEIPEPEFLNELARRTGCGLLLDINNVVVSAHNTGFDPQDYLNEIDASAIGEIHLAGHAVDAASGLRIDDHGSAISDEVAGHYCDFIARNGVHPTVIEWDSDVPDYDILLHEAGKIRAWMTMAYTEESGHVTA